MKFLSLFFRKKPKETPTVPKPDFMPSGTPLLKIHESPYLTTFTTKYTKAEYFWKYVQITTKPIPYHCACGCGKVVWSDLIGLH